MENGRSHFICVPKLLISRVNKSKINRVSNDRH
jgi:hypothetical protein